MSSNSEDINQQLFFLYKEHYFYEHDRREKILSRANFTVTIFSFTIIIFSYFIINLPNINYSIWSYLFIAFGLIFVSLIVFCFIRLFKFFTKYNYQYIPYIDEIDKYLIDSGIKNDSKKTYDYLIEEFNTTTKQNSINNDKRSEELTKLIKLIFICFILAALTSIPFFVLNKIN
ncbi:MAG: hypothetical protein HZB41_12850 [Ignavibacteriae bacterium]|nr:hypothetical protein [Ignavibacteriota bacterium]